MIQLSSAGKRYGEKLLFDDLDWLLTPQDRVGVVGANGTGKSTLLEGIAVLAGYDEAGGGKGYRPVDHSNAIEAMGDKGGTLTIEAGPSDSGKRVFFSVSDSGPGMTEQFIAERLFHPFATTKNRGVGLGLYTCREVVRANAGSIEVQSIEGVGTTFRVVLPSATVARQN